MPEVGLEEASISADVVAGNLLCRKIEDCY